MKLLMVLTIFLISLQSLYAQNREIELFINQVYSSAVPAEFKYYNLIDSSFILKTTRFDGYITDLKEMLKSEPGFILDSFIQKSKTVKKINWSDYKLAKACVYTYKDIPKFPVGARITMLVDFDTSRQKIDSLKKAKKTDLIVPVKKRWKKKRIDAEVKKAWIAYENSVSAEDKEIFRFSTPLIIGNYAIIGLDHSGGGAIYIFKKENGIWQKIQTFGGWVS